MFQKKVIVSVDLSPEELAHGFADMDSEDQAEFFNELAKVVEQWCIPFCFQRQAVLNSPVLTDEGRSIMRQFGDYGNEESL